MTRLDFADKWGYQLLFGYGRATTDCRKDLLRELDVLIAEEVKNLAQPAVSKCGGDCRKLLIDFHKWQQSMWTSPNAEITENVVDVFLKRGDSVCEPKGRSLKGWPYYGNSKSDD